MQCGAIELSAVTVQVTTQSSLGPNIPDRREIAGTEAPSQIPTIAKLSPRVTRQELGVVAISNILRNTISVNAVGQPKALLEKTNAAQQHGIVVKVGV